MAEKISLEGLQYSLFQPNKAIQKRVLAIIFKEEMIEAEGLVRRFLESEQDSELQVLANKVLQKLKEFQNFSDGMDPATILPLLKSPEVDTRLRSLRRLVRKKTPTLATQIQQLCPNEDSPEAGLLIMQILNNNPHPGNLPLIIRFIGSSSERLRMEAFRGLHYLINSALLPLFFRGLIDQSKEIQMMTMQMVMHFQRKYLLEALEGMLNGPPDVSQLASRVFSQLHGADLMPLLKKYLNHPDPGTALFLQTFYEFLGTQGKSGGEVPPAGPGATPASDPALAAGPAVGPLPVAAPSVAVSRPVSSAPPPPPPPPPPPKPTEEEIRAKKAAEMLKALSTGVQRGWPGAPELLLEPIKSARPASPQEVVGIIKEVFDRLRFILTVGTIVLYFRKGTRIPAADRVCFRAIQREIVEIDTLQFLQILAPAFPDPTGPGGLFPLTISKISRQDEGEAFFEPFLSLTEGLNLLGDFPEEAENFFSPAVDSLSHMLANFSEPIGANRLLVKLVSPEGTRVQDFLSFPPALVDPKTVMGVNLSANFGVLTSHDLLNSISLEPFVRYDPALKRMVLAPLEERTMWEFLKKHEVNEAYMTFLADTGTK